MPETGDEARVSRVRRGPGLLLVCAAVLIAVQLPRVAAFPAYDTLINLGGGWAWRNHPGINVYNPPAVREARYAAPEYAHMREASVYGFPFNSYISTPAPLLLYIPLSALGLAGGRLVWLGISVALYAGVLAYLVAECHRRDWQWLAGRLAVYTALYVPVLQDWRLGQTDTLLLALVCLTGWNVERRRRARGVGWEYVHVCVDAHALDALPEGACGARAPAMRTVPSTAPDDARGGRRPTGPGMRLRRTRIPPPTAS